MKKALLLSICVLILPQAALFAASAGDVVINEVAWSGTKAGSGHEWIELYNTTTGDINLEDWTVEDSAGVIATLSGSKLVNSTVPAGGYYLIQWQSTDGTKQAVSDITTDFLGLGYSKLSNDGDKVILKDKTGTTIDSIDCASEWYAGSASPDYFSMERLDPSGASDDQWNWDENDGLTVNGLDWDGTPLNGTPRAKNSVFQEEGGDTSRTTELVMEIDDSPFYPREDGVSRPARALIIYNVPNGMIRTIRVFDITGHLVKTLVDQRRGTGQGSVQWDGKDEQGDIQPVGIFIVHMEAMDGDTGEKRSARGTVILGR